MYNLNMICALDLDGAIGRTETNEMPWWIPEDLKYFKAITNGSTIIMGVNTFKSIGKILPGRTNVVISRSAANVAYLKSAGVEHIYDSVGSALRNAVGEVFIIGGQHIFQEGLHYKPVGLFLTVVHTHSGGDVKFPVEGRRCLQLGTRKEGDTFCVLDSKYRCGFRSDIFEFGGLQYEFTRFDLTNERVG